MDNMVRLYDDRNWIDNKSPLYYDEINKGNIFGLHHDEFLNNKNMFRLYCDGSEIATIIKV